MEAVEVVMGEGAATLKSVGFGNSEARAGDGFFDAEAFCKTTYKSSFTGANITNKFDDMGTFLGELFAKFKHFLFGSDFHCIIIP